VIIRVGDSTDFSLFIIKPRDSRRFMAIWVNRRVSWCWASPDDEHVV
jgi:hypothetical protein